MAHVRGHIVKRSKERIRIPKGENGIVRIDRLCDGSSVDFRIKVDRVS